jgi:hypothetical protein
MTPSTRIERTIAMMRSSRAGRGTNTSRIPPRMPEMLFINMDMPSDFLNSAHPRRVMITVSTNEINRMTSINTIIPPASIPITTPGVAMSNICDVFKEAPTMPERMNYVD